MVDKRWNISPFASAASSPILCNFGDREGSFWSNIYKFQTPLRQIEHDVGKPQLENAVSIIMESAINVLVSQFKTFAAKDGSSHTLSKEELQSLVVSQLPNLVKNANDPAVIDNLMGSLDENNDGELTFQEFWQLIGKLASINGGFS